ncbi:hypothetical protein FACS1894110_16750 [Spirochaetia bacterium]|nr:hypothetical protein FACS1894110_16750 [Spirochaetia bacterium]
MNPQTGERVASRSTRTANRDEAGLTVAQWLRDGIPTRRRKVRRTVEAIGGIKNILQSIEKTPDLDGEAALQITEVLRRRGLISFPVVKAGPGNVDWSGFHRSFLQPPWRLQIGLQDRIEIGPDKGFIAL